MKNKIYFGKFNKSIILAGLVSVVFSFNSYAMEITENNNQNTNLVSNNFAPQGYYNNDPRNQFFVNNIYNPANAPLAGNFGHTNYAPKVERNAYLHQVWPDLSLRRKLYMDPAFSSAKPLDEEAISSPYKKKAYVKPKKSSYTKAKTTAKPTKTATAVKSTNQQCNDIVEGRLKLDSGTHVMIDPGAHVVVWANDKKTEVKNDNPINTSENTGSAKIELIQIPESLISVPAINEEIVDKDADEVKNDDVNAK